MRRTGKPRAAAASISAGGMSSWPRPTPNPSPARPWSARHSRYAAGSSRPMPVVSNSSPPDSQGVGSASSEMCTQRMGASAASSPATSERSRSRTSSRTVSTSALARVVGQLARGLLEDRAQDALDLLEVLGLRDERRRELDDRVAAVVRAADQPAAVQLAGQEAAQQPLGLVVVEGLARVLVLDELDRVEVARAAHVADDRDVAQ